MKSVILFLLLTTAVCPQNIFNDFFEDKTLRLDYFHTGDSVNSFYSIGELIEEPYWGGSKVNLIDKFPYGKYRFEVYDSATNKLIYSRGYSTLFGEWQTTDEAKQTVKTFIETVTFPYPKKSAVVKFYEHNKKNELIEKFEYRVDPENYFIKTERVNEYSSFEVVNSGNPSEKVDIVIIPEGYTSKEMSLFEEDCRKFAGYLFNSSPFRENKEKFNIWGIEAPSAESGTDIPAEDRWRKTLVNSTFYTFDLDRYLMTYDNKTLRNIASNAPYDQIFILVNSDKYGGGSIYNHYSTCVNDNEYSEFVFVHEFGHGFASLADEYYTSDVAYQNFYPLDIEPLDPNLTTLVDFESKWKNLVDDDTPIPTPDAEEYKGKVGAFEGGGYMEKGIYRPRHDCTMKSIVVDNFCPVCKRAIQQMIDFYSE
ncbi:MAG: IgA Peptidase M64 [Ignavibacteria bacterium]|nr:IgA Peptidase M64 [Ignavibacteria bacterium]MBT8383034.1 IgA Peptidase M64 [Ignavibacteria bacterium]MBT8391858.1 IgA Peptidase M64 [Ignavibacteria bacterium]NNJ53974.1 peptidase M64 [Ignavibacteriaceae bacterium]NNL21491.1 peptidase M64 [Ignavibacteriaceae bacterium]